MKYTMKPKFTAQFIIFSVILVLIFSAARAIPVQTAGTCYVNDDATGATGRFHDHCRAGKWRLPRLLWGRDVQLA